MCDTTRVWKRQEAWKRQEDTTRAWKRQEEIVDLSSRRGIEREWKHGKGKQRHTTPYKRKWQLQGPCTAKILTFFETIKMQFGGIPS